MQLWRLIKIKYAATAFDGEGARIYGARWNSPGTRVAYASSNSALAVLEVLVHLRNASVLPAYSLVAATLPDAAVETFPVLALPKNWSASPIPPEVQGIGDEWIRSGRSLALTVPSAVVQDGSNVLINPAHPDFAQFSVHSVEPFGFDPRLLG